MSETYLTAEDEDVRETTNFSVMALLGFFLALAGLFSIQYVQMMPIAVLGGALGAAALMLAKKFQLSLLSRILALVAVVLGATTVSNNYFYRSIDSGYEISQARKVSEAYLDLIKKGDFDRVFFLVGLPMEREKDGPPDPESIAESPKPATESPTEIAMNRLRRDGAHVEIMNRKTPPIWVFVGVESEFPSSNGHTYKMIYKDEAQSIPPYYCLFARKNCQKYEEKMQTNWFIDKLETTKAP